MKIKATITGITKDDLVELFSTALYGSPFLEVSFNSNEYRKIPNPDDCECLEEKLAKMLLNGKPIIIYDRYAEDEEDFHGDLPHWWCSDWETVAYSLTLDDIKKGFEKCLSGTFKVNGGDDEEVPYIRECMVHLVDGDGDLDLPEASNLLQVVIFGQIVYG